MKEKGGNRTYAQKGRQNSLDAAPLFSILLQRSQHDERLCDILAAANCYKNDFDDSTKKESSVQSILIIIRWFYLKSMLNVE